eukprot:206670-Amphidinium_carterae.2
MEQKIDRVFDMCLSLCVRGSASLLQRTARTELLMLSYNRSFNRNKMPATKVEQTLKNTQALTRTALVATKIQQ